MVAVGGETGTRRVVAVSGATRHSLPDPCVDCVFWQHRRATHDPARKDRWVRGTPDQARARIAEYEATGIDRLLFQDFLPQDLDHIAVMGEIIS